MPYKEELLHYIWQFGLYPSGSLKTTEGEVIEVIDPGMHNLHAGPDFFNAKIKIGTRLWGGDVEIHHSSDEWERHRHHTDQAYNSVILHLSEQVSIPIKNQRGQLIPQCQLMVPSDIAKNAEYLMQSYSPVPCKDYLSTFSPMFVHSFLDRLAIERLERKTNDIFVLLDRFRQSWDDVFYVLLVRNFGFGLNSDPFERLALSLPYQYLCRHGDNLFQMEALLFGQAGLLDIHDSRSNVQMEDEYFLRLRDEYHFLQRKYSLIPLDGYLFKRMRSRPRSFPELRIAQLAALLHSSGRLFSLLLDQKEIDRWMMLFKVSPSDYWHCHYSFGKQSPVSSGELGVMSRQVLLINTVSPILFAYGKKTATESYCEKAVQLLESLTPERNMIVSQFQNAGIIPRNAFDTQALIQLRNVYCNPHKCLFCMIGQKVLSRK